MDVGIIKTMFQNAQQARDWLKELGYPVLETPGFGAPPLRRSAAKHIDEWALLADLKDETGLPVHIYWLRAVPEAKLNDLKYIAHVYHLRYPNVHPLFLACYKCRQQWRSVLICPNYEAPRDRWASVFYFEITSSEETTSLLRYDPTVPAEKHWQRIYATLRGEPMNARIEEAFECFITELELIRANIDAEIQQATQRQEYGKVQALAREADQLKELIAKVQQLKMDLAPSAPAAKPARRTRGGKGATPQKAYTLPLLQALVDLGGEAPRHQVLERVHELMKDQLKPADYEELPSGEGIRWQTKVAWLRFELCKQGYLRADTPYGTWAITEQGRQYLEQLKKG